MKRKGFTLIELMIVVAIIGILLAMLLPRVGVLIDRSREKTMGKNLKNIYGAIFESSQRGEGVMEWPLDADEARTRLLRGVAPLMVPYFDQIPRALLRRGAYPDQTKCNKNDIYNGETTVGGPPYPAQRIEVIDGVPPNDGGWIYCGGGPGVNLPEAGVLEGEVCVSSAVLDSFNNNYDNARFYPCQ